MELTNGEVFLCFGGSHGFASCFPLVERESISLDVIFFHIRTAEVEGSDFQLRSLFVAWIAVWWRGFPFTLYRKQGFKAQLTNASHPLKDT